MKKLLLLAMAGIGFAATANAQLADGTVFPDFTSVDIHGVSHHLYSELDSGRTVFIDISATWCPPCWGYHMTDALDNLYNDHGPAGRAGVSSSTTNDVVVYFFQGEQTSGLFELYGNTSGGAIVTTGESDLAHDTQGNWTVKSDGTTPIYFPIIDDSSSSSNPVYNPSPGMNISFFPTIYMICRDRLVHSVTQPTEAEAYAATSICPSYAPSSTVDVKASAYTGNGYFLCTAAPTVSFQNYSTVNLTAATIKIMDGSGTVVATQAYSGPPVAPYGIGTCTISTAFAGTTFAGYKYSVTAVGDTHTANDISVDSVFKVYATANATALPYSDDIEAWSTAVPYKYSFLDPNGLYFANNSLNSPSGSGTASIIGTTGSATNAFVFDGYDACHAFSTPKTGYKITWLFGNYNVTANQNFSMDVSYAGKSTAANTTDHLLVEVSTNCGSTWTTAWDGHDAALTSTTTVPSTWFVPAASTDWRHVTVPFTSYVNSDLMVRISEVTASSSANGELMYLDNVKISAVTAVENVNENNFDVSMFTNPAHDQATINMNLNEASTVSVVVYDAMGRVVNTTSGEYAAGNHTMTISTEDFATGLYTVKVSAAGNVSTTQLSVVR